MSTFVLDSPEVKSLGGAVEYRMFKHIRNVWISETVSIMSLVAAVVIASLSFAPLLWFSADSNPSRNSCCRD